MAFQPLGRLGDDIPAIDITAPVDVPVDVSIDATPIDGGGSFIDTTVDTPPDGNGDFLNPDAGANPDAGSFVDPSAPSGDVTNPDAGSFVDPSAPSGDVTNPDAGSFINPSSAGDSSGSGGAFLDSSGNLSETGGGGTTAASTGSSLQWFKDNSSLLAKMGVTASGVGLTTWQQLASGSPSQVQQRINAAKAMLRQSVDQGKVKPSAIPRKRTGATQGAGVGSSKTLVVIGLAAAAGLLYAIFNRK